MKLPLGSGALWALLLTACETPAPPVREAATSEEAAPKTPECDVDSAADTSDAPSSRTEEERGSIYRAVHALRQRALEEAQEDFPTPQAPGIAGPGQAAKELAVERARTREAESLERHYLGQLAFEHEMNCGELAWILREGDSKGWPTR